MTSIQPARAHLIAASKLTARPVAFAVGVVAILLASGFAVGGGFGHSAAAPLPRGFLPAAAPVSTVQSGPQLQKSPFLTSPGTHYSQLQNASIVGPVDPTGSYSFTIGFQMRNEPLLASRIVNQSTPGSPQYHQWLSLAQEQQLFGPDPTVVQDTVNYFTSMGFHLSTSGPISLSFTGTALQVDQAFKTNLMSVRYGTGSLASMSVPPLSLPGAIARGVASVNGLDSSVVAHPLNSFDPVAQQDLAASGVPMSTVRDLQQNGSNLTVAFNYTNQAFMWFRYFSHHYHVWRTFQVITPASLNLMYNATGLLNQGYNGDSTGRPITIALVMAGGINPDDIRQFSQLVWNNPNQVFSRLVPQPVDGSFTDNGTQHYTDGVSNEMALDIEFSSTMAPQARIMPVYGPCLCTNVLDDDYATIDGMTTVPNIISNSWGGDEDTWPNLYGPNWVNSLTMHHYFMLLTARGSTILSSSGDGGGFDQNSGMLAGNYPATDPYVLSVDGLRTSAVNAAGEHLPTTTQYGIVYTDISTLTNQWVRVDKTSGIGYQSFWYEPLTNTSLFTAPPQASGGFGTSYWFNQSWWQHSLTAPNLGRSLGSGVAAEADFNMTIYFDGQFEWFYGGTSFACPTTAGMWAIIEDYLLFHHIDVVNGSVYLGNGNLAAFRVGNAWENGNLTLVPYYDVTNGTSYWGNQGVYNHWQWPPGQVFPFTRDGKNTTYGDSLPGWDFPTGWGSINVYNFAHDLGYLDSLPGQFMTLNNAGSAFDPGAWANLVLNRTYNVHVTSTAQIGATGLVTIKFFGENGQNGTVRPVLTPTFSPSLGDDFTLDTSVAPFLSPGYVVFEFGNSSVSTLGFGYSWVNWAPPAGGVLNVSVVQPTTGTMVGGYPQFNSFVGGFFPPVAVFPNCCTLYPNTFTVRVTFNGKPVYNAQVTATIPNTNTLAWAGTTAQAVTQSLGRGAAELAPTTVSSTFTNSSGFALVYTWNVIAPTNFIIRANYSTATATTNYTIVPGPNVGTTDGYGGKYSAFNTIAYILYSLRRTVNNASIEAFAPNALNQSSYYDLMYGWAGEEFPVTVNNYVGAPLNNIHVWLATSDQGSEHQLRAYKPSFGAVGVTNSSGTTAITDASGHAMIQIPDNMSSSGFFNYPDGSTAGFGFVAASIPGAVNRTFSYTEPCLPTNANSLSALITCQYNDTYQRNYTAAPLLVLPNPVKGFTQTQSHVARDFFGVGSNISFGVNVGLRSSDPVVNGFGWAWPNGLEHITAITAWVDGTRAADITPPVPPDYQNFTTFGNLSGNYAPGIHVLKVMVNDSLGHIFTNSHTFVVGAINLTNLGVNNIYTVIPFLLNWTINIPYQFVNNHTFSQSVEVRYVTGGCGGAVPCPSVVNLTIKVHPGQTQYNQSINQTMLNLNHFYSGTGALPPGQYQVIVWLNANHSGSVSSIVTTSLIFDPVQGTINGPGVNATVPIGNVTVAYSYTGSYITNASLAIYSTSDLVSPVFTVGAFVPGTGLRGGSTTWPAVQTGPYEIVLQLGTPYGNSTATNFINVTNPTPLVYLNQSSQHPLIAMNPAMAGTILALVAGIVGLLLGLFVAPTFRRENGGPKGPASPKAWDEGAPAASPAELTCSICKEKFSTVAAVKQHQQVVHGLMD